MFVRRSLKQKDQERTLLKAIASCRFYQFYHQEDLPQLLTDFIKGNKTSEEEERYQEYCFKIIDINE